MTKRRRDLYRAGRRGDAVRVLVDPKDDRAIVHYRDGDGVGHKRKFANTKEGRAEAIAFAEGWFSERERMERARREAAAPAPLTVRELWTAFKHAEFSDTAGEGLRKATQVSYAQHFRRFELFVGADRAAETIKVPELARMRKEERTAGRALNQTRQTMNVVRIVFRWGIEHELLSHSPLAVMRWKTRKDQQKPLQPDEYTTAEFEAMLRAVDRDDTRQWRAWVFLMLVGHYGMRANAVLHLRWQDIDAAGGTLTWPARYQKQGVDLVRPQTWEAWSALLVAKTQRERVATFKKLAHHTNPNATAARLEEADWVLFAERDKAQPMSYQSMHYHLAEAEKRAGVAPKPFRKAHGFRRMVVGNVIEATGDRMLGLEVVGDKDPKVLVSYDRRLAARVEQGLASVATAGASGKTAVPESEPSRKRPETPETETAPVEAGAVTTDMTGA